MVDLIKAWINEIEHFKENRERKSSINDTAVIQRIKEKQY